MTTEPHALWTPTNVEYIRSWRIEENGTPVITEDGQEVYKHEFRLSYRGEVDNFGVVAEADAGDAWVEDMAAATCERAMKMIDEKLERRGGRVTPEQLADPRYFDRRRELAAVWRDYLKAARRRRATTTGRIYHPGIGLT